MRSIVCKARSTFPSTKSDNGRFARRPTHCVNCMLIVVPIFRTGWSSVPIWGVPAATALAFADPLGLEVHPDIRVRERSFGDWEGIPVEELAQRYPEDYVPGLNSVAANSNTVPNPRRKSDVVASKR